MVSAEALNLGERFEMLLAAGNRRESWFSACATIDPFCILTDFH